MFPVRGAKSNSEVATLLNLVCSDTAYTVGHVVVHCLLVYMKCHKQVHVPLYNLFMNGLRGPRPHVIGHVISGWGQQGQLCCTSLSHQGRYVLFSLFSYSDHSLRHRNATIPSGDALPICKRPWSPPICYD